MKGNERRIGRGWSFDDSSLHQSEGACFNRERDINAKVIRGESKYRQAKSDRERASTRGIKVELRSIAQTNQNSTVRWRFLDYLNSVGNLNWYSECIEDDRYNNFFHSSLNGRLSLSSHCLNGITSFNTKGGVHIRVIMYNILSLVFSLFREENATPWLGLVENETSR